MWSTDVPGPVGLWESYVYRTGSVSLRAGIVQLTRLETSVWSMVSREGTVRAYADSTRAFEYPQYQSFGALRGSVRTVSARTGYIYQGKPEYSHLICTGHVQVRQDCLGAFYGHKLVGSPCLNVMHAQLPGTAILHPYGPKTFKNSAGPCTGPGEALECTYWLYKPGQTEYVPFTTYRPCTGPEILPRGYTAPLRIQTSSKNLAGPARHALWLPTGSHGLGPLTVREVNVTQALI